MKEPTAFGKTGEWLSGKALGIGSAICLATTLYLAVTGDVTAGSLTGTLCVVLALLHSLPHIEYFKALGVEAKMRERLKEADDILAKLKQSAIVSARLTYHTLGWQSRIGGAGSMTKQKVADENDKLLVDIGVAPDDIAALKSDYLFFAAVDIFKLFQFVATQRVEKQFAHLKEQLNQLIESKDQAGQLGIRDAINALGESRKKLHTDFAVRSEPFRKQCRDRIPELLPERERAVLSKFADRLSDIVEECMQTGRVTDEAAGFIDMHATEHRQALERELFEEDSGAQA